MYHGFSTQRADGHSDFEGLHLEVNRFRNHLRFLRKHYNMVSLEEVVAAFQGEATLPDRAAVITIDDGYRSVASLAFPLLEEFGTPASVFLCTDFIDGLPLWNDRIEYAIVHANTKRIEIDIAGRAHVFDLTQPRQIRRCAVTLIDAIKRVPHEERDSYIESLERRTGAGLNLDANTNPNYIPMSWNEVRSLAASELISIGNHTKSHAILSQCKTETIRTELITSKRVIEEQLGRSCALFCYPNGKAGDFDERTRSALVEAGFVCGLTTVSGLNGLQGDIMALRRYFTEENVSELAVRISGIREMVR